MTGQSDLVSGETFEVRFTWGKKRHHPRYQLEIPVEFTFEGETGSIAEHGIGRDISLGGAGVAPPQEDARIPPVGSRVRLQLTAAGADKPLELDGIVAHADAQHGFGLQFPHLTSRMRMRLKQLLTELATHEPES